MKKLKIAYFGTPSFSANFLEKLITDPELKTKIDLEFVITQPDRPVGRKQILTPSPVKKTAIKNSVNVAVDVASEVALREPDCEVASRGSQERRDHERQNLLQSIDLALVYAFGKIIPKNMLDLPKYGFWCIHPSLLPKYRGPAPIAYPLLMGDKTTGVTIIQMDEKIDHGPIIIQDKLKISPTDRRPDLENKLTDLALELFIKAIKELTGLRVNEFKNSQNPLNSLTLKPQTHELATHTKLLKKSDGFIPFNILKKALNNEPLTPEELPKIISEYLTKNNLAIKPFNHEAIYNYFRGLSPWPGLWTLLRQVYGGQAQKRLKITELELQVTSYKLQIKKVQLEGKKEVDFKTFNKAYKIF